MPVRKRNPRQRMTETLAVWESVFSCEYDYFRDLADVGIALDEYDRPDLEVARAAWLRFGPAYLELPRSQALGPSWAERAFGRPWEMSDAG